MSKKDNWIKETQMFQRIAKIPESSYEELSKEYDKMISEKILARKNQRNSPVR